MAKEVRVLGASVQRPSVKIQSAKRILPNTKDSRKEFFCEFHTAWK